VYQVGTNEVIKVY